MSSPYIVSLGEVLWDLFPEAPRFGGAPANFACHAAILGADVSMCSVVGDDLRGREAVESLKAFGIDVSIIQTSESESTGSVAVQLNERGEPTFLIHEDVAWDHLSWTPELETRLSSADAVYFGTLGQRSEKSRSTIRRALDLAQESSIPRVLDINLRPPFYNPSLIRESIEQCTLLKLSNDELEAVTQACDISEIRAEDQLRALLDRFHLDLVAMTRGDQGALLVSNSEIIDQPGLPTEVCDTVGAGDAFAAALILGRFRGDSLEKIAHSACEYAGTICSQSGAVPTPPARAV